MIVGLLLFLLFSFLIFRWNFIKQLPFGFVVRYSVFLFKLISAIVFFYIYTYYYSEDRRLKSDLWKYYEDASAIYELAKSGNVSLFFKVMLGNDKEEEAKAFLLKNTEFWYKSFNYGLYNENRTIIRFLVIMMFLTGKNIYALSLIAVFLSYLGSTAIFLFFYGVGKHSKKVSLFITSFLLPSVVFWTSPLLKEMLAIFFLGFTVYFFYRKRFLYVILFFLLLFFTKIYIALALLPSIIGYWLVQKTRKLWYYSVVYFALVGVVLVLHFLETEYSVIYKLSQKQHDFINMAVEQKAGSYIELLPLNNSLKNMIKSFPEATINVFFRPFVNDFRGLITVPNIVENVGLLMFIIFVLLNMSIPNDVEIRNVVLMSLLFSVVGMLIIGYTVPVLGALVRYRSPFLPFFVSGLVLICKNLK